MIERRFEYVLKYWTTMKTGTYHWKRQKMLSVIPGLIIEVDVSIPSGLSSLFDSLALPLINKEASTSPSSSKLCAKYL